MSKVSAWMRPGRTTLAVALVAGLAACGEDEQSPFPLGAGCEPEPLIADSRVVYEPLEDGYTATLELSVGRRLARESWAVDGDGRLLAWTNGAMIAERAYDARGDVERIVIDDGSDPWIIVVERDDEGRVIAVNAAGRLPPFDPAERFIDGPAVPPLWSIVLDEALPSPLPGDLEALLASTPRPLIIQGTLEPRGDGRRAVWSIRTDNTPEADALALIVEDSPTEGGFVRSWDWGADDEVDARLTWTDDGADGFEAVFESDGWQAGWMRVVTELPAGRRAVDSTDDDGDGDYDRSLATLSSAEGQALVIEESTADGGLLARTAFASDRPDGRPTLRAIDRDADGRVDQYTVAAYDEQARVVQQRIVDVNSAGAAFGLALCDAEGMALTLEPAEDGTWTIVGGPPATR